MSSQIFHISITFFYSTLFKIRLNYNCNWTRCKVCYLCSWPECFKMRSQKDRKWQTSNTLIDWAVGWGLWVVLVLSVSFPLSSFCVISFFSASLFCYVTQHVKWVIPPTMCRHIACGIICLVFVILFENLLNVLIIFFLFFVVNNVTRWS